MKSAFPYIFGCLLALLVSWAGHAKGDPGAEVPMAALLSMDEAPYRQALEGFRKHLLDHGVAVRLEVVTLQDADAPRRIEELAADGATRLILTLGTAAAEAAIAAGTAHPIVAGLIVNGDVLAGSGNATGVVMEFPVETELKWLRHLLPEARKVGVIYNPDRNSVRMREASEVSLTMDIELERREIREPSEISAALKTLSRRTDVLWGITDELVLNPKTAKQILLFSFRNQIPFVGLSPAWVKAGALYSLDWDYQDMGMQCGALAIEILGGKSAGSLPPAHPRKAEYCLNARTAKNIKIEFSEEVLKGAKIVF